MPFSLCICETVTQEQQSTTHASIRQFFSFVTFICAIAFSMMVHAIVFLYYSELDEFLGKAMKYFTAGSSGTMTLLISEI
jgi:hypothetical protein